MRPNVDTTDTSTPASRFSPALRLAGAVLGAAVIVIGGYVALHGGPGGPGEVQATGPIIGDEPGPPLAPVVAASTTASSSTTTASPSTSTITSTTSLPTRSKGSPSPGAREVVPLTEAEPEAKQLAVDVAYSLTTYEASDDHMERFEALGSRSGAESLARASAPLTHTGSWSRGEVIYPQLGGLKNGRASVMVVTRQTVGSGPEAEFSVVRTLDIRLALDESGWEFDYLSSAGGTFDRLQDLAAAHDVARDPRIVMPDSARLDILSGLVSPTLLRVMAELADQTSYEVVVLATGHPHHVFETDRRSQHTVGQAVDINRIGERLVVDDRGSNSATRAIAEWLYDHPDVRQVGSPWDLDGAKSGRSFTDAVHQDHIHLAVDNDR